MQRVSEFELPYRSGDSGAKYLMRGPILDWGVILLRPGEKLGTHYHNEVEETFYFLRGEAILTVEGRDYKAIPGDVYRLPAPERHSLRNEGSEDAKLVFIKAPFLPEDKVDC